MRRERGHQLELAMKHCAERPRSYERRSLANQLLIGLYTDESPGLKVDPVVVMTLSVVFIFSVVALHGMSSSATHLALGY
jgi:preprotein translocase subunit Sec61beta